MIKRPKPGEDEDDLLRMQEEFLKEKSNNRNLQPAAQVVNVRRTEPAKRSSTTDPGTRKPSKYAQSKGLKNYAEKRPKTDGAQPGTSSVVGDILEKNIEDFKNTRSMVGDILEKNIEEPPPEKEDEDDNVYFPKVIPKLLGNIVEKNVDSNINFDFKLMPAAGFPVVKRRDDFTKLEENISKSTFKHKSISMDVDETASTSNFVDKRQQLPTKSVIVTSKEADEIHKENIKVISKMSEKEILEEQQKLLSTLDPKLVEFIKAKRKQLDQEKLSQEKFVEKMDTDESAPETPSSDRDTLWENDVLSHPNVDKWLHFDSLEKDKLQWMKGIEENKKIKPDEPYEARFDFKGYLLPYTMEYTEETKTLFHHGEEPHRPGYSLTELMELTRSTVTQQRVMALNTIAGILDYHSTGIYKDIIEIQLTKIFFVIRIALDENKVVILEPALKALRNLIYNRIDEASLDALLGFEEGTQQPSLENDKSEIEELESNESELKDFHLAEIYLIAALLRTEILQRLFYILDTIKPSFNCVQYSMQILTRLARDSVETATRIVEMEHLMQSIINNFIPKTSINFAFDPQNLYKGKPILAAVRLLRILALQSWEIGNMLITMYNILSPISEYVSSGVDGTYGLRIQIEATCLLSNLLQHNLGIENARSLYPIIVTSLYKHVQGTDVFANSSIISATHAAVVLQFVNRILNSNIENLDNLKHQIYPLIKDGVKKWLTQLAVSETYTCGHLRLVCASLDCCKSMILAERLLLKFLNDSLKFLSTSRGFKEILKNLVASSNLLSGIDSKDLQVTKNLMSLGGSVIDSTQKVLPLLNVTSPMPFLASLFNLLALVNDRDISNAFLGHISFYLKMLTEKTPSLCDNWFTRIETEFVFAVTRVSAQNEVSESGKDLIYAVANKLCYILRIDKKIELEYLFNNIVFNKEWFTAERLLKTVTLSDADSFTKALTSIDDIRQCYRKVVNLNYEDKGPNIVLKKWQEPILPRDWIYLPILSLYSRSQEIDNSPKVSGEHAAKVATLIAGEKKLIITCSLEWILFNELCFPDLLNDINVTDRFCRIMCMFLCDNSLFLDEKIKVLLQKCTQILFKKKSDFNFDQQLTGLNNFQDFYTQFLEQFQSVSYGDHIFAACVLVPIAQKHNVKWRKLLWSEYAGCLRALDCPEDLLCYDLKDYLYPEETDESVIKSYCRALSSNLLRAGTIAFKIASHHVQVFRNKANQF